MHNNRVLFELVRAGLWEKEVQLLPYKDVDYDEVYRIADEQSVLGLVTAGIEHVCDVKIPQEVVLLFVGTTLQLEQRNQAMNDFVAWLIENLRKEDVYTLLLKGQGVAQCYERPLWRASGDVDLLLSKDDYQKAKSVLCPLASSIEEENTNVLHLGLTIGQWMVEMHGSLRSRSLFKMDHVIDCVVDDIIYSGEVRSWMNGSTHIFLPAPDNDVILIFTHIIKHFFRGGIGLRQICDWCRLLWTFRDSLNHGLLESRIRKGGMMTEWRAFAALAVEYLGMPEEVMPLYSHNKCWHRKSIMIMRYVLAVGNFGNNRDRSYYSKNSMILAKILSLRWHTLDFFHHVFVFPKDTTMVWLRILLNGTIAIFTGKDNGNK